MVRGIRGRVGVDGDGFGEGLRIGLPTVDGGGRGGGIVTSTRRREGWAKRREMNRWVRPHTGLVYVELAGWVAIRRLGGERKAVVKGRRAEVAEEWGVHAQATRKIWGVGEGRGRW